MRSNVVIVYISKYEYLVYVCIHIIGVILFYARGAHIAHGKPPLTGRREKRPELPPNITYPAAIATAAGLLKIGAAFALGLAERAKLPGVRRVDGEYFLSAREIQQAIYELDVDIANVPRWHGVIDPKFGLERPRPDPVPPGPDLGEPWEWPDWMSSSHVCGACGHDGRLDQVAQKERCYGHERSRYMRS